MFYIHIIWISNIPYTTLKKMMDTIPNMNTSMFIFMSSFYLKLNSTLWVCPYLTGNTLRLRYEPNLSQLSQPLPSVHLISFILSQRCNIGELVLAFELRLIGPLAWLHFGIWSNHWSLQLSLIHSYSLKLPFLNISIITYLVNSVLVSKPHIPW
jgi:hypothetical protein